MRLYLVRHAEAMLKSEDSERPLSEAGTANVQRLARFLAPLGLRVQAIWHSGKARAVQTAQILGSAVCADQGLVMRDDLNPNDKIRRLACDIEAMDADVMIVGHLPHLGKLAGKLLTGSKSNEVLALERGGMVCLDNSGTGNWQIVWMLAPDLLVEHPAAAGAPAMTQESRGS